MTPERLASMPMWAVTYDCETHLVQPGLLSPPLVCGSVGQFVDPGARVVLGQPHPGIVGELLSAEDALAALVALLEDEKRVIVGAFICFDMLVAAVEMAKRGRDIFPLIFRAYEQGRVYDILIAESLNAIADGTLGKDPRTMGDLRDPISNEPTKYYSLAIVTDIELGRTDAKANDEFRRDYATLDGVPIEEYPPSARTYPVDDAVNTHEDMLAQIGVLPKLTRHVWHTVGEQTICSRCNVELMAAHAAGTTQSCWVIQKHRNLHQMADQAYTAWVLYLGAAWGFNVDQKAVTAEFDRVTKIREAAQPSLMAAGFLKWKKEKGETKLSKSKSKIAKEVAIAYGATGTCPNCAGHGKVRSPSKKDPVKRAWDPQRDGIGCLVCCGTGFDLTTAPALRKTDASGKFPDGQIKANADVLNESGSELLRSLADFDEDAKTVTNYVPYLRKAQITFVSPDGTSISYPRPLTLKPNVLLETDRVSYGDAIQQFPRSGGLRACIVAREGFALVSCDYNQGELITHSQSCLWILGYSDLSKVMLSVDAKGKPMDPHASLAATILGIDYNTFDKKIKKHANIRQAAKPWNFGRPGGMGVPKLVMNQRDQGPDTPCALGPVMIFDEDTGKMVPGYRGLRFCILMDGAPSCGAKGMAYEWGKVGYERPIPPTCRWCLECAARLDTNYFETWSEARPYFKFTSDVAENGQALSPSQCQTHGLPPGSRLAPGEMIQHVSHIIRGGVGYTDCSNGYFQSLLAVASKLALRRAQRECCDVTFRVPTDACKGGKVSKWAGQVSPLLGSRCVVLQHDEIIAEILLGKLHEGAWRLSEIMERALQEVCPDLAASCKAPPAAMRRWHKSADACYDVDGRLIPWEPKTKTDLKPIVKTSGVESSVPN